MKNKNWIEDWAKQYDETKKLPEIMIPCSTEGCDTKTTCCSTNLHSRVAVSKGGIRTLLSSFKCRSCRKQSVVVDGTVVPERKRAAKKITKTAKKQTKIEALTEVAKSITIDVNAVPVKYSFDNPEHVKQLTEGSCQRPDIYLDNDRACDGCSLYEHCACASKQLLADSGRRRVVTGPRRKK